jgi:dihydrofolate reductase
MRKIKLYIAASLNGKIAKTDGSVGWLEEIPNPDKADYGYANFFRSVDTTLQGSATYAQVLSWGIEFPYQGTKNYVLTRRQDVEDNKDVSFIKENHIGFIQELKEQEGKDIWLIGGGQINTLLFNAGLIDEIQLFIMPIVLTGGIEIFEGLPDEHSLQLIESKTYASGAVELKYQVLR